ncbi:MAG TPA: hypothetical protein VFX61_01730, partial [Micromonosporaceae bacterium]|nr:hypothetical protein [Micromonosporaceae bacterium]
NVIVKTRQADGWMITGRWLRQGDEPASEGPYEVVVRLRDDAPADVRERGIDPDLLSSLQWRLNDMTAEVHEILAVGAYQVMVRQYIEKRLAELPAGLREVRDAYYRGLLDLFEDLTSRGHADPLSVMATAMGVSTDTLNSRLRTARRRRTPATPADSAG